MKIGEMRLLLAELDPELEIVTPRDRDGGINHGFTPLKLVDTNRYKLIYDESDRHFVVFDANSDTAKEYGDLSKNAKECVVLDWEV